MWECSLWICEAGTVLRLALISLNVFSGTGEMFRSEGLSSNPHTHIELNMTLCSWSLVLSEFFFFYPSWLFTPYH